MERDEGRTGRDGREAAAARSAPARWLVAVACGAALWGAACGDGGGAAGVHGAGPVAATDGGGRATSRGPEEPPRDDGRQRGVCWAGGDRVGLEQLRPLAAAHVGWISQSPFGWMRRADSPEVRLATTGVYWGETDEGLIETARLARALGIRTLLKPDIWITRPDPGTWRGDVAMKSEADWARWWEEYRAFILHYARLAESAGIEVLSVGTELRATIAGQEPGWRRLIGEVRSVYRGKLVYAANWHREFEEVPFWDALDFIGIQAYFPLASRPGGGLDELRAGWRPHLEAIERVRAAHGKPVLFTEIGYRSDEDAAVEPWRWPDRRPQPARPSGLAAQALCYRAFFETLWEKEWFAGAYIWKWHPHRGAAGRLPTADFSPQGKPALLIASDWFARPFPSTPQAAVAAPQGDVTGRGRP